MNENPTPWAARWGSEQIRALLLEQAESFWRRDLGVEREQLAALERAAPAPHAVIVSGLRRVGKSTLLAQLAHRLGQEAFYYVNFEDERFLGFGAEDANDLYRHLAQIYGQRRVFILDEIQNVPGWERFVRRWIEQGYKLYITGSNASLLSQELGTRLTGRYVPIELFPFSFREFLSFQGLAIPDLARLTTADQADVQRHLRDYLLRGGIPDPLKYPDLGLYQALYNDILYRDIAARYRIGELAALKELAFYLASNPASLISLNKLKEHLRLGSVNTVKSYLEYLTASWLFFSVNVYDYAVRRQQIAPKKVYGIDTGLLHAVGFAFSPNTGKLIKNLVFLALRRSGQEVYYVTTPNGYEVDFYLPQRGELIQVALDMNLPATRERETRALADAMRALGLVHGTILCEANQSPIQIEERTIAIRSTAEWLLGG